MANTELKTAQDHFEAERAAWEKEKASLKDSLALAEKERAILNDQLARAEKRAILAENNVESAIEMAIVTTRILHIIGL